MEQSIIHPKLEGTLVLISGLHGLGKTLLSITMENPALTGMIDFDIKSQALAEQLKMAWYKAPESMGSPEDYDVANLAHWFVKTLTDIPSSLTHLIIDNATWAEAGLGHLVAQNPTRYGLNTKNVQAGIYGGVNPGITVLWSNIFTFLQGKGIKVVTVINHMSQPWVNGAPTANKFNIKGNKVFNQIASLAIILTPANPHRGGRPPVPSGLIVKEALSQTRFENGEFSVTKVLPARLPVCTWKNITGYFDKPADFANPASGEEWIQAEVNSYSEWLSPEQVQWVMKVRSYSEEDEPEKRLEDETLPQAVERLEKIKFPGNPLNNSKQNGLVKLLKEQGIINPNKLFVEVFGKDHEWSDMTDITAKNLIELVKRNKLYNDGKLTAEILGYEGLPFEAVTAALIQECVEKSLAGVKFVDVETLLQSTFAEGLKEAEKQTVEELEVGQQPIKE